MANTVEFKAEFKKKRKGWPIFFILLAIAFPVLNYFYFGWMNPIYAIVIGAVVFIICIARIKRIKKMNAVTLSCCETDICTSIGKRFYRIPYKKITRLKKTCRKGIKIKAGKAKLRFRRLKNRKEILALIKTKMEQPDLIEVDTPVVEVTESPVVESVEDALDLEKLLTGNKTPVVVALLMNAPANGIPVIATPVMQTSSQFQTVSERVLPELPSKPPVTVDEKLRYNKILWLRGDITEDEKNRRNEIIYREEFPELYGGKAKKMYVKL